MISVLIVDDQALARAGLRGIFTGAHGFDVVGECEDGAAALGAVERRRPDIVLMDVRMGGMDGVVATRALRSRPSSPPVLVLTTFDDDEVVSAALRAGAAGFVLKDAPVDQLHAAVRSVAAGQGWLDPAVTGRVMAAYASRAPASPEARRRLASLTQREREVLALVGRGASNAEIAARLFVGPATVKTHIGSLLAKLHLRDRPAAIVFAYEHGVVSPGQG